MITTHVIVPGKVLLEPVEDIFSSLLGENTLIQIRTLARRQPRHIMKVDGNFPDTREGLGRTRFDLALVGNGVVQGVGPNGQVGGLGADGTVPKEVGVDEGLYTLCMKKKSQARPIGFALFAMQNHLLLH